MKTPTNLPDSQKHALEMDGRKMQLDFNGLSLEAIRSNLINELLAFDLLP